MSRVISQAVAPGGVACSPQVPVRPESRSSHPGALVSLIAAVASLLGGGLSPWAVPPALLLGALGLFHAAPAQAQNTAPSALRNVQWTPGNASVALTWEAPSSWGNGTGGGINIQHNIAVVYNDLANAQFDPEDRTKTSYTFAAPTLYQNFPITNGNTFNVRLRAWTYRSGYDPDNILSTDRLYSPWTTLSVTVGVPAKIADSALTVTPGSGQLDLTWTAPANNGSAITGYDVHYTSAPTSGSGAVTNGAAVQTGAASAGWKAFSRSGTTASQSITGLTNDTAYRVRVRAKNTHGSGPWVFGTGTPEALVWSFAPSDYRAHESELTRTTIRIQLSVPAPAGGVTFMLSPLFGTAVPSTTHSRLCDVNSGRAEQADLGTKVPTTLTVDAGETIGGAKFPFVVDAVEDHNECFAIRATTTASGVTLRTGTQQYDVAHVLIQERVPDEPTVLTAVPGNAKLDLSWTASAVGVVAGYDVHYTSAPTSGAGAVANSATATGTDATAAWVAVPRSGTTATQSITGLTNGRAYRVRVRATNSGGLSPWVFATGTPNTKTFEFTRDSHLVPPAKGFFDLRIRLSETAPAGGLSFTLTQLLGASVPAGLCDDGEEKATAEDIGANPPAALTVQAGQTEGRPTRSSPLSATGSAGWSASRCRRAPPCPAGRPLRTGRTGSS